MTTVGYGDYAPHSDLGKAFSIGLMLLGIGFVAVLTDAVAERFLRRGVAHSTEMRDDVEELEVEIVSEIAAVRQRLQRIERLIARRA